MGEPIQFDASTVAIHTIQPLTRVFRNVDGRHLVFIPTDSPFGINEVEVGSRSGAEFDAAWFSLPLGVRHGILTERSPVLRSRCSDTAWGATLMAFEHFTAQFPAYPSESDAPTLHPVLYALGAHTYTTLTVEQKSTLDQVLSAERFHLPLPAMLSIADPEILWARHEN